MSEKRSGFSTYALVTVGAMVAIGVILKNPMFTISTPFVKFNVVGSVVTLAGLWFGPVLGGICGGLIDLIDTIMTGQTPIPLITMAYMIWGIIPALVFPRITGSKKRKNIFLVISMVIASVMDIMVLTYAGLVFMFAQPAMAILPARLIKLAVVTPVNCILVALLYYSPLSALVRQASKRIKA